MQKLISLFFVTCLLAGCADTGSMYIPSGSVDKFEGMTFVRNAGKDSVSGKDIYEYLEFLKNKGIDRYIRYNDTESPTNVDHGKYEQIYINRQDKPVSFLFSFSRQKVLGEFINNRVVVTSLMTSFTYVSK